MAERRYRSDVGKLRRTLEKRASSLKRARDAHEGTWKKIRKYFEPMFGRPLDGITPDLADAYGRREDEMLLNSHPRMALARLGAGMHGGITSPASQWFRLAVEDSRTMERRDAKEWLDAVTRRMSAVFAQSNIYTVLHGLYLHLGAFGTAAALVVPDDRHGLHALLLDEGAYWIACDGRGRPATLLRAFVATADQIAEEFGEAAAREDDAVWRAMEGGRRETPFVVWNLVSPRGALVDAGDVDRRMPYVSAYWREGSTQNLLLGLRGFSYNPILAPRWHVLAGPYGYGPGHMALGDAMELQRLESDLLQAVAKGVNPPVTAPESMRDEAINTFPGAVTYRRDGGMGADRRPSVAPLYEMRLDTMALREQIRAVEDRINRAFYTDLFAMLLQLSTRPKQMTAREVSELSQEKMSLIGPVLTRMNTDLLDPLIDAAFAILQEAGLLPEAPEALQGMPLTVRYVSALHTEQQSTSRLGSMVKLLDFGAMVAAVDATAADKIDTLQAIDEAADVLDVPAGVIRSDEQVAEMRQARADAAAAQAAAAAAPGMARAAKDLSETPADGGGGTALDGVMGAVLG